MESGRLGRLRGRARVLRGRHPALDHAVRAYDRQSEVLGGQVAGAVTYFGFLSFFPLLALAFAVVGYIGVVYPDAEADVSRGVAEFFPSLIGPEPNQIDVQDFIDSRAGAGLVGLLGLLYAGLGWVDAMRDGLRRVFGTLDVQISLLRKKLVDVGVLALLGVSLLASLVVTSTATAVTTYVLDQLGMEDSLLARGTLKLLSITVSLAADTLLFAIVLSRLSGAGLPWRRVRSGALLAACGFEVLKLVGTFLIGRTTENPVYATFGVIVGLLVWINFVARLLVFSAAWTATQPYSLEPDDVGEPGAGRSTALAAATEPVLVVAPPGYEPVGSDGEPTPTPRGRGTWRAMLVGGMAGIGATTAVMRARRDRRSEA